MNQFAVQHIRFLLPSTFPIHCLAFDKNSQRLALSRSNGSLEVYYFKEENKKLTLDFALPAHIVSGNVSSNVEALVFHNGRLFSAGTNGCVVEYDFERMTVCRSLSVGLSSIWALSACASTKSQRGLMACGCDSGNVYLLDLNTSSLEDCLELSGPPLFHSVGRVLSLCWVSEDKYLVAGGISSIFVWKNHSRSKPQILWQLTLPKNSIVWSLVEYPSSEHVFVSSDSRGIVSVWNARNGTLISEIATHQHQVLTLSAGTVNNSDAMIFAAGVDPTVVAVYPTSVENVTNFDSWMSTEIIKANNSDVRASCFVGSDLLATAGIDKSIVISRISSIRVGRPVQRPQIVARFPPFDSYNKYITAEYISSSQKVLAFSNSDNETGHFVEIWQLLSTPRDYESDEEPKGEESHEPNRQVVARLSCNLQPHIVKLAPLANFLAFAVTSTVRTFKLDVASPSVSKHFSINFEPIKSKYPAPIVTDIAFAQEPSLSPILVLASDGQLVIQSTWCPDKLKKINLTKDFGPKHSGLEDGALPTKFLRVINIEDEENAFLVAIGSNHLVRLYKLLIDPEQEDLFSFEKICRLPHYAKGFVTALSVHSNKMVLVAFSDLRVAEFDGKDQKYTEWTRRTLATPDQFTKPKAKKRKLLELKNEQNKDLPAYPFSWTSQNDTVSWIGYASTTRTNILVASSRILATIDKTKPIPMTVDGFFYKSPYHRNVSSPDHNAAIHVVSRFRYIMSFDCLKPVENSVKDGESEDVEVLPGELFVAEYPAGAFRSELPRVVTTKKQFGA